MTHGSINEFPGQAEQTNKKTRDAKNPPRERRQGPPDGSPGTVYHRGGNEGPSAEELKAATLIWLQANKPEALQSKVKAKFAQLG